MVQPGTNLPPLSSTRAPTQRASKNPNYPKNAPEWFYKLAPNVPQIWLRDYNNADPNIVAYLEDHWKIYARLGIHGKGEGGKLKYNFRYWRVKLDDEYRKLPDDVRKAKEIALARHRHFVFRCESLTLDYGTERKVGAGEQDSSSGQRPSNATS